MAASSSVEYSIEGYLRSSSSTEVVKLGLRESSDTWSSRKTTKTITIKIPKETSNTCALWPIYKLSIEKEHPTLGEC